MIVLSTVSSAATVVLTWIAVDTACGVGRPARRPTPGPAGNAPARDGGRGRRPSRALLLVIVASAVGVLMLAAPFLGGITAVAAVARRPLTQHTARRRRRRSIEQQQPAAIELLVLLVRSGLTPNQAVRRIVQHVPAPTSAGFEAVVARLEIGERLADALAALPATLGAGYGELTDALALAERYGLPLESTLDRLGTDVRNARRRLAEADARRLPVKLAFPLVVCTLPSFVLMAIAPAAIAAIRQLDTAPF